MKGGTSWAQFKVSNTVSIKNNCAYPKYDLPWSYGPLISSCIKSCPCEI